MADEGLLSMRELADYLGVSYDTVREWRRRNTGPIGYRVGKHVKFRRELVDEWLEQRRDPAPAA